MFVKNESRSFVLKGTFLDTPEIGRIRVQYGYAVCLEGICENIYEELPERFVDLPLHDCSGHLILPGFTDLHLHAPQYNYRGMAMDCELLEWLERYTFPEEGKYADLAYADRGYSDFVDDLQRSVTTHACIFATIHTDATLLLMEKLQQAGLEAYVGKLNMDRNSPDSYREESVEAGLAATRRWLEASAAGQYGDVRPMITPRFTPSVTDEYMEALGKLAKEYHVPAQSHLSENTGEIEWVKALCPDTVYYAQTYSRYGLFGGDCPTIMAHCIYSGEAERSDMKSQGVYIAHCPTSNENVIAGIAPAANYLRHGYHIGLGSDVAGGHTLDLTAVMAAAVQVSKLRWKYIDASEKPLTIAEAFYMATVGGGSFFGKVGLFEPGYSFDAVVPDETELRTIFPCTPEERLERFCYVGSGKILRKYRAGSLIWEKPD